MESGDRGVKISRNGGSCPSPSGRRWPEGPDEGAFPALTRRFAPPSPKGRGTFPEQVSQIENPMKFGQSGQEGTALLGRCSSAGRLDSGASRVPHRPDRCIALRIDRVLGILDKPAHSVSRLSRIPESFFGATCFESRGGLAEGFL